MKKVRISVYLDQPLHDRLGDFADRRRAPVSLVAEAAIAAYLSPDAAEQQEAAFTRRLDRLARQGERHERDLGISIEMLALFVRFWLTARAARRRQRRGPVEGARALRRLH